MPAGDSFCDEEATSYPPPRILMKNLRTWLNYCFSMTPSYLGNSLPHGIQRDTFSCGVFVINTFSHAIFGERLLSGQQAVSDRINWFVKLGTQCIQAGDVCAIIVAASERALMLLPEGRAASLSSRDHREPSQPYAIVIRR